MFINDTIVNMKQKRDEIQKQIQDLTMQLQNLDDPTFITKENETVSFSALENDTYHPIMLDRPFKSQIRTEDMRCLALVAHNHMKPAMRQFVLDHKNILKKFRLTGTNTTMTMLREVFGNDPSIQYGPTCQSGPLGGDAELCALMCMEELGGIVFLQDPMDSHPHQADIACLNRLAHVHDVLFACNPCSANAMATVLRVALQTGNKEMIAPFFKSQYSPSVMEYKRRQDQCLNQIQSQDNGQISAGGHRGSILSMSTRLSRDLKLEYVDEQNIFENFASYYDTDDDENKSSNGTDADADADIVDVFDTATAEVIDLGLDLDSEYEQDDITDDIIEETNDEDFNSEFFPDKMRCLALIAHNHMKPAMRQFVLDHKNILKKFRLTGTNTTMTMLREVFGNDPSIQYGPTCQSGPLGGDAELCALMCMEELGGIVFLQDPMDSHPHQADIDCLNRQCNVHDIYVANNRSSADAMMTMLRLALQNGNKSSISSFFQTNVSPSVLEYKRRQQAVLDASIVNIHGSGQRLGQADMSNSQRQRTLRSIQRSFSFANLDKGNGLISKFRVKKIKRRLSMKNMLRKS